jgi:tetratricopeptide (TPR) repeat protein
LATAEAGATASPNSVAANVQLGLAYYKAGQFDTAATAYETAAQLSQYRPLFYTGNVVGPYRDDPVFALTLLSDGLQHNNNARMQLELWTLATPFLEQAASLPQAQPVLLSLSQSFPDQAVAVLSLAQNYVVQNQLDNAQPVIDSARQKFPDLPLTHYVYAEYLAAKGETAQAEAEYEIVIANQRTAQALKQAAQKSLDKLKGTTTP